MGRLLAAAILVHGPVRDRLRLEPAAGLQKADVGTTILTAARASCTMNATCLTLLPIRLLIPRPRNAAFACAIRCGRCCFLCCCSLRRSRFGGTGPRGGSNASCEATSAKYIRPPFHPTAAVSSRQAKTARSACGKARPDANCGKPSKPDNPRSANRPRVCRWLPSEGMKWYYIWYYPPRWAWKPNVAHAQPQSLQRIKWWS